MASRGVTFDGAQGGQRKRKAPWSLHPDRYDIQTTIGTGSYGNVYGGIDKFTRKGVAIKRSTKVFNELTDCKRMLREIAILNRVDHKNIVKLNAIYLLPDPQSFDEIALVLEQCQYDLKKLFKADDHLDEEHSRTLFFRICSGVHYLHSVGIWHRDLKPANILLNMDCTVKICDFGLARCITGQNMSLQQLEQANDASTKRDLTAHVVTRWYRAPELILLHEEYTEAIDNWSLGCILFELMLMEERYCKKSEIRKLRGPLFPGECCYPLSPRKDENGNPLEVCHEKVDQLKMIFAHVGTPDSTDYGFLSNEDAKYYLSKHFPAHRAPKPMFFSGRLRNIDQDLDCLLRGLLMFNPSKRMRLDAVLRHEFLANARKSEKARYPHDDTESQVSAPIKLPFNDDEEMTAQQLRECYAKEEEITQEADFNERKTKSVAMR